MDVDHSDEDEVEIKWVSLSSQSPANKTLGRMIREATLENINRRDILKESDTNTLSTGYSFDWSYVESGQRKGMSKTSSSSSLPITPSTSTSILTANHASNSSSAPSTRASRRRKTLPSASSYDPKAYMVNPNKYSIDDLPASLGVDVPGATQKALDRLSGRIKAVRDELAEKARVEEEFEEAKKRKREREGRGMEREVRRRSMPPPLSQSRTMPSEEFQPPIPAAAAHDAEARSLEARPPIARTASLPLPTPVPTPLLPPAASQAVPLPSQTQTQQRTLGMRQHVPPPTSKSNPAPSQSRGVAKKHFFPPIPRTRVTRMSAATSSVPVAASRIPVPSVSSQAQPNLRPTSYRTSRASTTVIAPATQVQIAPLPSTQAAGATQLPTLTPVADPKSDCSFGSMDIDMDELEKVCSMYD